MRNLSTFRIVNLVLFALLAVGFGFLGIYYGCLVAPFIPADLGPIADLPEISVGLGMSLGGLGLAGMCMSLIGLAKSIRSFLKPNDNALALGALSSYVGLGFVIVLWLFLNAAWLYRLTTTNFGYSDFGWILGLFLVLSVAILIAINVPFVKLHGDDQTPSATMDIFSSVMLSVDFAIALPMLVCYIASSKASGISDKPELLTKLLTYFLITVAALLLAGAAKFGYGRAEKKGTVSKVNALLFEGGLCLNGAFMIVCGVFAQIYEKLHISLLAQPYISHYAHYVDFAVMSYIIGGVIVLVSLGLLYSTLKPSKSSEQR